MSFFEQVDFQFGISDGGRLIGHDNVDSIWTVVGEPLADSRIATTPRLSTQKSK